MSGINILNATPIMKFSTTQENLSVILLTIIVVSVIGIVISVIGMIADLIFIDYVWWLPYVCSGLFIICIILGCIFCTEKTYNTGRCEYEATIDDGVSITEVYKKYDVVKQKGKIWILKDKEVKE